MECWSRIGYAARRARAESCWFKMAAAEGPAGDGELWQSWLPNHAVFLRLREGLKNQSPAEAEKPAASTSPSCPPLPPHLLTRNLVFGLGGELFLWDAESSAFLVVRLRGPSGGGAEPPLSQYQVRRPVSKATLGRHSPRVVVRFPSRWLGSVAGAVADLTGVFREHPAPSGKVRLSYFYSSPAGLLPRSLPGT